MKRRILLPLLACSLFFLSSACAPINPAPAKAPKAAPTTAAQESNASAGSVAPALQPGQLPVRFQQPTYSLAPLTADSSPAEEVMMPVNADISTKTPVPLRDIIKRLAELSDMNISWANDVDQSALVDVDIRAEDDLFQAIAHMLRQLDYFHEIQGNTIVIKYKETRKYHIAMPFVATNYSIGMGGDVLGAGGSSGGMQGQLQITSANNSFDIWKNIQDNLDKVLEIWQEKPVATPAPAATDATAASPAPAVAATPSRAPAKGYYTIDKPIGLITVTAPRSLLEKVDDYFANLTSELYRQVIIEAKIVEVTLNSDNTTGIDWEALLDSAFSFKMDFQKLSPLYPTGEGRFLTLSDKSFSLMLDALKTQGSTEVIANPKISVLNGQPALINIGDNVTYVDSVTTSISDSGIPTTSVTTASVLSGLGLSVIPTILDNKEVILTLAPVTSKLSEPIEYRSFGSGGNEVGLPRVKIREMNTLVKIRDNEMLVVGGLIDSSKTDSEKKIPGLGDLPGIKKLFSQGGQVSQRKELIIFLKPRIIS